MKREPIVYLLTVALAFAVFLPLYYVFSYGQGDALERTIEQGNGAEGDSGYSAPFSYGESYLETLAFGIFGMLLVFSVFYVLFLIMKKRRRDGDE